MMAKVKVTGVALRVEVACKGWEGTEVEDETGVVKAEKEVAGKGGMRVVVNVATSRLKSGDGVTVVVSGSLKDTVEGQVV